MKLRYKLLIASLLMLVASIFGGAYWFEQRFFTAAPNRLRVTELGQSFQFEWGSFKDAGHELPHAFMFVPVKLNGIDRQLFMLFDLGAPSSKLYAKPFESLAEHGFQSNITTDENNRRWFENLDLQIGTTSVSADYLQIINYGRRIDWLGLSGFGGMSGNAVFLEHVLVLDAKENRFSVVSHSLCKDDQNVS